MDKTPAYNALLNIRATAQTEIQWIDDMVAASDRIVSVQNPGVMLVCDHLIIMKQIIMTQDEIIAKLMESFAQNDEFLDEIKKKLNAE